MISDPSKTAVVVGCSSSAGREITQDLHMNGWKVAGVDRETPSYSLEHFFKVSRDCPEEISDIASRCWYCQIKFATLDSVYHVTLPVYPVI